METDRRFRLPARLAPLHPREHSPGGRTRPAAEEPDGDVIIERLVDFDDTERRYSYAIAQAPFPVVDYISTLRVHSITGRDDTAEVQWSDDASSPTEPPTKKSSPSSPASTATASTPFTRHSAEMEFRQLGRSGLRVSVLAMGTMTFGGSDVFGNVGHTDVAGARRQNRHVPRCGREPRRHRQHVFGGRRGGHPRSGDRRPGDRVLLLLESAPADGRGTQ